MWDLWSAQFLFKEGIKQKKVGNGLPGLKKKKKRWGVAFNVFLERSVVTEYLLKHQ